MPEQYYTYYASPIGLVRVSSTDNYICEVHFMDTPGPSPAEYPSPETWPPVLQQCIEQLIEYFQGQRRVFDLPVYQEGTPFQQKVWGELLNIPFGKTISYLELSKRIGDPKAIRAAAATNGKNNIAIIVPCHRVIGSNRDMVGYAGGIWRKKWLLQQETKILYGIQTLF
jgi:methylated-DNA-[protein]-cysteine S-methyltransferase